MADSGYGRRVEEDVKTADIDEVKRRGPEVVSGEDGGDVAGDDQNGREEGAAGGGDRSEEQVAKKPRVEKLENGGAEKAGHGVESLEGVVEEEGGVNGGAEGEEENGVVGAGEEEGEGEDEEEEEEEEEEAADGVTGKDAAPGDVGLRTLLQEGENTKTSVAKHGADATHMLNGAK